jgi:hypothetical protein
MTEHHGFLGARDAALSIGSTLGASPRDCRNGRVATGVSFGGSAPRVSSGDRKPDDVEPVAPNGEQSVSATQVTQRVDAQARHPPVCARV